GGTGGAGGKNSAGTNGAAGTAGALHVGQAGGAGGAGGAGAAGVGTAAAGAVGSTNTITVTALNNITGTGILSTVNGAVDLGSTNGTIGTNATTFLNIAAPSLTASATNGSVFVSDSVAVTLIDGGGGRKNAAGAAGTYMLRDTAAGTSMKSGVG